MSPLTPFDRDEWSETHPEPRVFAHPSTPFGCAVSIVAVAIVALSFAICISALIDMLWEGVR